VPTSFGASWFHDPGAQFNSTDPSDAFEPSMTMGAVEPELVRVAEPERVVKLAVRLQARAPAATASLPAVKSIAPTYGVGTPSAVAVKS
jgi:hypothetical protein